MTESQVIMFTMAKIMEMEQDERNKIVLYLINNVKANIFVCFLFNY